MHSDHSNLCLRIKLNFKASGLGVIFLKPSETVYNNVGLIPRYKCEDREIRGSQNEEREMSNDTQRGRGPWRGKLITSFSLIQLRLSPGIQKDNQLKIATHPLIDFPLRSQN